MTGEDLIEDLVTIIDDAKYAADWVEKRLNQAMQAILGRVILPALFTGSATVTTDPSTNMISLPDDFHSKLYYASIAGEPIRVLNELAQGELKEFTFGTTDDTEIRVIGTQGTSLVYSGVPTVETAIDIKYMRKPNPITDSSDEIDGYTGFPEYEEPIVKALMSHVCRTAYNLLETGYDDDRANTKFHDGQYALAIAELESLVAGFRPIPTPIRVSNWV